MNDKVRKWIRNAAAVFCLSICGLGLTVSQLWANSLVEQKSRSEFGLYGGDRGHDVPTPFSMVNQRFELADGEVYHLIGRVVFLPSPAWEHNDLVPYFQVDLNETPEIGNLLRSKVPYYRLEGSAVQWKKFECDESLGFYFKAHGRVIRGKSSLEYSITLEPLK
jgi:hypothetical protein